MRTDDIVKQRFAKVFRGYDVQEVDLFLDDVIREMDRLEQERNALLVRLEALLLELDRCDKLLHEYQQKENARELAVADDTARPPEAEPQPIEREVKPGTAQPGCTMMQSCAAEQEDIAQLRESQTQEDAPDKGEQDKDDTGISGPDRDDTGKSGPDKDDTGKSGPDKDDTGKSGPDKDDTGNSGPDNTAPNESNPGDSENSGPDGDGASDHTTGTNAANDTGETDEP